MPRPMASELLSAYLAGVKKWTKKYLAKPGAKLRLEKLDTDSKAGFADEAEALAILKDDLEQLSELQEKLYAGSLHTVLIILQGMDASGKDGVVRHVITGLSPEGCRVTSFRQPTREDNSHDLFWRYNKALPEKGQVGIFNRSYYEHVLICKVHPELVLEERIPGHTSIGDIDKKFWEQRYRQINRYEKNLVQSGVLVLKFFLHISKHEQRKRFLERIDDPAKQWKFSFDDLKEREHWSDYMKCYKEMVEATSTDEAPWYIIPADHKWVSRTLIAGILTEQLASLNLEFPELTADEKKRLDESAAYLRAEQ